MGKKNTTKKVFAEEKMAKILSQGKLLIMADDLRRLKGEKIVEKPKEEILKEKIAVEEIRKRAEQERSRIEYEKKKKEI